MVWIVLFVSCTIMFVLICVSQRNDYCWETWCYVTGLVTTIIGLVAFCGSIIFFVKLATYKTDIAKYQQRNKQIEQELKIYSNNANFAKQFGDAIDEANCYNLDVVNNQVAYKTNGILFTYRNNKVLELPIIDIDKYTVYDSNINIKINKE